VVAGWKERLDRSPSRRSHSRPAGRTKRAEGQATYLAAMLCCIFSLTTYPCHRVIGTVTSRVHHGRVSLSLSVPTRPLDWHGHTDTRLEGDRAGVGLGAFAGQPPSLGPAALVLESSERSETGSSDSRCRRIGPERVNSGPALWEPAAAGATVRASRPRDVGYAGQRWPRRRSSSAPAAGLSGPGAGTATAARLTSSRPESPDRPRLAGRRIPGRRRGEAGPGSSFLQAP